VAITKVLLFTSQGKHHSRRLTDVIRSSKQILRQQLTFNELFLSCFAPPPSSAANAAQSTDIVSSKLPSNYDPILLHDHRSPLTCLAVPDDKVLKSIEVRTEAPHLISVTCWHRYGLLKLNIRIKEDGEIETKLLTPNTNLTLSDVYIAKVTSIPFLSCDIDKLLTNMWMCTSSRS